MSQSLVIFAPSGNIIYQFNNKIIPFNDLIASIVNQDVTELEANFFTTSSNQKRFYCYRKNDIYTALYFDMVTTIDNEKIKQTLIGVLKTYFKLMDDLDEEDQAQAQSKLKSLVDLQFNQLMKLQSSGSTQDETIDSGSATPTKMTTSKKTTQVQLKKKMRKWIDGEMVEVTDTPLDFSVGGDSSGFNVNSELLKVDQSAFEKENNMVLLSELNDIIGESDDEEEEQEGQTKGGIFSEFTSYFSSGADIDEFIKKFNEHLINKNVAPQTAKQILDKIRNKLKGKQVTINSFKQALVDELTKVLSPNVSTDLLYDIKQKSNKGRPYVISVVGVNGVGKSTNLAKLAYWFLQNNLNVLICACDTFRSGAVEQLKVHVNNLKTLNSNLESNAKIDIFEKGYGGGDHVVATAKGAIQYGATENYDIILIDTAGRTHSNAKLMAPLKKFGDAANPDKIIMVGEALVGTDSVEQAINFNSAFGNKRSLDFFIISKVDTVGDLVGTMINMVMATNVPILFMGTGQTYTDIKRLNVKTIVDSLMK